MARVITTIDPLCGTGPQVVAATYVAFEASPARRIAPRHTLLAVGVVDGSRMVVEHSVDEDFFWALAALERTRRE